MRVKENPVYVWIFSLIIAIEIWQILKKIKFVWWGKCPKISSTKLSDKVTYANTVCHSFKYFKQQVHEKQNLRQNSMEWSVEMLRHLPFIKIPVEYMNFEISLRVPACA